jgi:hypothetical protein
MNEHAYCELVCILTLFDMLILITWQTVGCKSVRVDVHPRDWLAVLTAAEYDISTHA